MNDDAVTTDPAAPPAPPAEPAARWEDYIDVFFSPTELFRRRATDRVAPPLLTLLALAVVFYFILLPANAIMMRASMAGNPEALEAVGQFALIMQIAGGLIVPITYLILIGFTAALLLIVGRFAEIRTDFSRTMLIATYAGFVYLLAQIAGGVGVIIHGEAGLDVVRDTSFGVLRFIGSTDMNQSIAALLRRIDIFSIWQAVLWTIGIRVIYNVTTMRAGLVAGVTWILFAVPGMIMGALGFGGPPAQG